MNHSKLFKSLLLVLIAAMLPQLACAYDFIVDGLCYNYNEDGTSVTVTWQNNAYPDPYYTDLDGDLEIPESVTYEGITYSVTTIGVEAFINCSGLTSVTIPNSVTSIGNEAFYGCTGLTSITIGDSVTSIGNYAFASSGLTSVTIPNSVTSIFTTAFYLCNGLTSMVVESGNTKYDSRNNCNAIIETASNSLIIGCKNTIIPNSVASIGENAFRECSGLTSVTIPNSVTSIGPYAFYGCTGLTSIAIPNSVTSIGGDAFSGCTGLTSVEIPNSVTSIGWEAFSYCWGLTSVTIPNSVTSIGDWAFNDCSSLTSVTIGNSVTEIGKGTFAGCSKIRTIYSKIVNPESVTYGSNIFQGVITNHCKLYVPTGKVEDYQFTAPWSDFLNILEEGGGSTTPVYGDVNGDGIVTVADVTAIYKILLGQDKGKTQNQ